MVWAMTVWRPYYWRLCLCHCPFQSLTWRMWPWWISVSQPELRMASKEDLNWSVNWDETFLQEILFYHQSSAFYLAESGGASSFTGQTGYVVQSCPATKNTQLSFHWGLWETPHQDRCNTLPPTDKRKSCKMHWETQLEHLEETLWGSINHAWVPKRILVLLSAGR